MKAIVVHSSLNTCGGAARVSLHIIRFLQERGYGVELLVSEPTKWHLVKKLVGINIKPIKENNVLSFGIKFFGIYMRLLVGLAANAYIGKYDIVINTYGDAMIVPADITYIHFPALALYGEEYISKYRGVFWSLYFAPYRIINSLLKDRAYRSTVILTNSRFSADAIKKTLGKKAIVVHPPVDIDIPAPDRNMKEDVVIYVARYSEDKKSWYMNYIAKLLPDIKFICIGRAQGRDRRIYRRCIEIQRKLKIRNIKFYANLPRSKVIDLLLKAKVYLHLMPYEHFGIAPLEGMAAGAIPIVHKISGAYTDILEEGKYGYGFRRLDPHEIADLVEKAINSWNTAYIKKARDHIRKFRPAVFYKKFEKIIDKVEKTQE